MLCSTQLCHPQHPSLLLLLLLLLLVLSQH
jgi:hypothetical protein